MNSQTDSYQWYATSSADTTSATNSSYTIPSVQTNDFGTYQVNLTGLVGSPVLTMPGAFLNVILPPQVLSFSPPTNVIYWLQTNYETLTTVVTNPFYGSYSPITYQWYYNGAAIPSATGNTTGVTETAIYAPTAEGTNTVVVTNWAGSTNMTWTNIVLANPGMVENWGKNSYGECNRPVWLNNAAAIVAGDYQSIAVSDTNSVTQWGEYSDGVNYYPVSDAIHATQPPAFAGVVAVAAGRGHALALTSSNTVIAWGLNSSPASTIPAGVLLTNITAIACGYDFSLVLSNNGTVFAWGDNNYGETSIPANVKNIKAISASGTHALALDVNGIVYYWGTGLGMTNPGNVFIGNRTNVVAIASGTNHDMALFADGTVVSWGLNNYTQTNVPPGLSNVMAIAAGDNFSMALLNTGTIVPWGDDTYGQTNMGQFNTNYPLNFKLIAAGGNHAMAALWSPLVQYSINVAKDLLLIYNTNSLDSSNVCVYYQNHRPMVSGANVLGIGCTTNETFLPSDYTNIFVGQVTNWLNSNPTKRPSYVILFPYIPSRVNVYTNAGVYDETVGHYFPSVQYQLNQWCATNWHPFVTGLNMNELGGTSNCIAYINKLAYFGSNSPNKIMISARAGGYGNNNYYLDDTENGYGGEAIGGAAEQALLVDGVLSTSIFYTNAIPDCGSFSCHITSGTNVAGYFSWGAHSFLGMGYATNNTVKWNGNSGWFLMATIESFNGFRNYSGQGNFLSWYSSNAFGGSNYSNTPVAAVSNVDEPQTPTPSYGGIYFGLWGSGKNAAICAWAAVNSAFFQAVGDPFVTQ